MSFVFDGGFAAEAGVDAAAVVEIFDPGGDPGVDLVAGGEGTRSARPSAHSAGTLVHGAKKALAFPKNSFSFSSSRTRRLGAVFAASSSRGLGRPSRAA